MHAEDDNKRERKGRTYTYIYKQTLITRLINVFK